MNKIKIRVVVTKNYRTEVYIDGLFAYESFIYRSVEIKNLKILIKLLQIDNVEIVDDEETEKI